MENLSIESEEGTITKELNNLEQGNNNWKLVGGLAVIIIGLGLSYSLNFMYLWIPASFLLLFFWTIYSGILIYRVSLSGNKANENLKVIKILRKDAEMYLFSISMKTMKAGIKAIASVFAINIVIVMLYLSGMISIPYADFLELGAITIISSIYILAIFFVKRFISIVDEKVLPTMKSMKEISLPLKIGVVVFLIFIIGVPLIGFIEIVFSVNNWILLLVILFIQFLIIMALNSYFTFQQVRLELQRVLNELQKIKDGVISNESLPEVVKFSRYDIVTIFDFLPIYVFRPHPYYLEEVLIPKHKRTRRY